MDPDEGAVAVVEGVVDDRDCPGLSCCCCCCCCCKAGELVEIGALALPSELVVDVVGIELDEGRWACGGRCWSSWPLDGISTCCVGRFIMLCKRIKMKHVFFVVL